MMRNALAVAGFALITAGAACFIAEPPAEAPRLPDMRPTILHGSVVPPPSRILTRFPREFVVPVELLDPSTSFQWQVFVDYDPFERSSAALGDESIVDPTRPEETVRPISFTLDPPSLDPGLRVCHVIEFIVARGFSFSPHTPDARGGDSVVWFYNPTGDLSACPAYDGGVSSDGGNDGDGGVDAGGGG